MAFFNTLLTLSFFCFLLLSYGSSIIDSTNTNFSGTILAPPDFIFTSKILPSSPPPRPSSILLRYHTLTTPLTWINLLSSSVVLAEIPTLYNTNCLFLLKSSTGELSVSSTSSVLGGVVNIKQPDIYVDDHLTVHGIDGVLDPTSAMQCSQVVQIQSYQDPHRRSFLDQAIRALRRRRRFAVVATALTVKRQELLSLRSVTLFAPSDMALFSNPEGFRYDYRHHVVPKRYRFGDLSSSSSSSTVFETLAPNKTLVVDLVDGVVTVNGVIVNRTEVYRNRWIVVMSVSMSLDDAGYLVDSGSFATSPSPEIMENRYPHEIINGFNDSVQSPESPSPSTMENRYPDEKIDGFNASVQSPSPGIMELRYPDERINGLNAGVQSPSPAKMELYHSDEQSPSPGTMELRYPDVRINGPNAGGQFPSPAKMELNHSDQRINGSTTTVQSPEYPSPAPMEIIYPDEIIDDYNGSVDSPSPSPATTESEVNDSLCVFGIPSGMEAGDLLCPASGSRNRNLQAKEDLVDGHVASSPLLDVKDQGDDDVNQSQPLISSVKEEHSRMNIIFQNQQDQLNIANDLFFYF